MNAAWALHNIRTSWNCRAGAGDFTRQMLLRYACAMPSVLRRSSWTIGVRCPPPVGQLRLVLRDNGGADLFIFSEVFEHRYYALPLLRSPATILDLGANIGLSALYFARAFPLARLACVEPGPENVAVLRRNLQMNAVVASVFAAAAHVTDGTVALQRTAAAYGHRIAASDSAETTIDVAALSIPTLLERLRWERIGLAKIDIEGHETVLLAENREWLHRADALCIEYHTDAGEWRLTEIARRYGFMPPRRLPGGLWFLTRSG